MSEDKVTLRDVYDAINRLEDKFDERLTKVEKRVDVNEAFRNRALGVVGAFSAFFSLVATYIWERVIK